MYFMEYWIVICIVICMYITLLHLEKFYLFWIRIMSWNSANLEYTNFHNHKHTYFLQNWNEQTLFVQKNCTIFANKEYALISCKKYAQILGVCPSRPLPINATWLKQRWLIDVLDLLITRFFKKASHCQHWFHIG